MIYIEFRHPEWASRQEAETLDTAVRDASESWDMIPYSDRLTHSIEVMTVEEGDELDGVILKKKTVWRNGEWF